MKSEEEKIYFKKRDGTFFKEATKEEIYDFLDIYNFDIIKSFLKHMDYPWLPELWLENILTHGETPKNLARYINYCNLKAILPLVYKDSKFLWRDVEREMFETIRKRMDPDYYGD